MASIPMQMPATTAASCAPSVPHSPRSKGPRTGDTPGQPHRGQAHRGQARTGVRRARGHARTGSGAHRGQRCGQRRSSQQPGAGLPQGIRPGHPLQ